MNIVFMGTPEFAGIVFDHLCDAGLVPSAVFTQPDTPKGRGNKMLPPPVKIRAAEKNIPLYQPVSLKKSPSAEESLDTLKALAPDVIVVAAYGKILPAEILELPKYGCINVHASLLPKYRGAAPIQRCLMDGAEETGVTIMQMAEGLDTGDMLMKEKIAIDPNETADELTVRLAHLGGDMAVRAVNNIESLDSEKQDDSLSTYAFMIDKSIARLDFTQPAKDVHNMIRGLSSNPGAFMMLNEKRLKVYHSVLSGRKFSGEAGQIGDKNDFTVICGDGHGVTFTEVQYEGGKRIKTADFLRGNKI